MPSAIHRHYSSSSSTLAPLRRRVVVAHSCRLRKHDVKFDDFNISDVRCGRRRPTPTTTTIAVVVRFQLLRSADRPPGVSDGPRQTGRRIKMDVFTASWRRYITLLYSCCGCCCHGDEWLERGAECYCQWRWCRLITWHHLRCYCCHLTTWSSSLTLFHSTHSCADKSSHLNNGSGSGGRCLFPGVFPCIWENSWNRILFWLDWVCGAERLGAVYIFSLTQSFNLLRPADSGRSSLRDCNTIVVHITMQIKSPPTSRVSAN